MYITHTTALSISLPEEEHFIIHFYIGPDKGFQIAVGQVNGIKVRTGMANDPRAPWTAWQSIGGGSSLSLSQVGDHISQNYVADVAGNLIPKV